LYKEYLSKVVESFQPSRLKDIKRRVTKVFLRSTGTSQPTDFQPMPFTTTSFRPLEWFLEVSHNRKN
jgi:hypothetical protein